MNSESSTPSILLVDDTADYLEKLATALKSSLRQRNVSIRTWQPGHEDADLLRKFESLVDEKTVMVATDYDLTSEGMRGFFGSTIVGWCQRRFIPVGDFSRANSTALTKEPDLFELRIPSDDIEGARFITTVFNGFSDIRDAFDKNETLLESTSSLSAVLSGILCRPQLDSHFALYMLRFGMNQSAIVDYVRPSTENKEQKQPELTRIVSYLLGHVLLNSILRFPGPILSEGALCAYLATTTEETEDLKFMFKDATYDGPFGEDGNYFWREKVDEILDNFDLQNNAQETESQEVETFGDYNRKIAEVGLKRPLKNHECKRKRCNGFKGGFLCPFTQRTVCERADCSVSSSIWISQGADLCRIEREFFDEWAPILGL